MERDVMTCLSRARGTLEYYARGKEEFLHYRLKMMGMDQQDVECGAYSGKLHREYRLRLKSSLKEWSRAIASIAQNIPEDGELSKDVIDLLGL